VHVESGVSDQEWITAMREGDRDAFAACYRRFRPDVYRFAAHMTGSAATAEDIVQDVFLAVIRDIRRFDPGRGSLLGWLLGITRNHVRRWQHRRRWLTLTGGDEGTLGVVDEDPAVALSRQQTEAALTRALTNIPARYREVIVLCDLQELPYEAAAEVLHVPVGTVRSRLHRGRARLAQALGVAAPASSRRASVARVW
jgi:RNA polymerase sigma-70 factor (ECF subfamily)